MCTSFAVYGQSNPIYGMNFDADDTDLKLNMIDDAVSTTFYFSVFMEQAYRDIAGMNSNGLFICTQALEYGPDFKPGSHDNKVYAFDVIGESLKAGANVSDFFDILNNRNVFYSTNPLFPEMGCHTIIADQYGDAVILEEGLDENVISKIDRPFMVMTNFPNGNFKDRKYDEVCGCGADRYIKAHEIINDKIGSFGVYDAFDVLRKTSQDITICSIVLDPLKSEAYVCFKMDFDKIWKVLLKEKTICSLNGLNDNQPVSVAAEGIIAKQLYKFYET